MVRNIQEWRRMSGEQFSAALEQVGLGRAAFAWILGTRSERVTAWAKGAETVPFYMDVLLSLMTLPGAREMVLRVVRRQQIGDQQAEREFDAWERGRDG
jgi:DNA-binding transcriptional regulator YiaG